MMTRWPPLSLGSLALDSVLGGFDPGPVPSGYASSDALDVAACAGDSRATVIAPLSAFTTKLQEEEPPEPADESDDLLARLAGHAAANALVASFPDLDEATFSDAFYAAFDEVRAKEEAGFGPTVQLRAAAAAARSYAFAYAVHRGVSKAYASELAHHVAQATYGVAED